MTAANAGPTPLVVKKVLSSSCFSPHAKDRVLGAEQIARGAADLLQQHVRLEFRGELEIDVGQCREAPVGRHELF